MNWTNQAATENQAGPLDPVVQAASGPLSPAPPGAAGPEIRVGKSTTLLDQDGKTVDIFTLSIGSETIHLLPLKTWAQLDLYKWRVRGKLPATPAGLEITPDHVKISGETVRTDDPEGCGKLESIINHWLALERETLALARKKAAAKPAASTLEITPAPESVALHFQVQHDKEGQVHITCFQGKEPLALIGLNPAGFSSLVSQGFMRKPHRLQVGALHDWVELDGTLYSFEKGNSDAAKLEKALNEHYLPASGLGQGKDVVVFANAASSTGFDIQFPVTVAGVRDQRKRPLNEESLEILQDPERCGLLHKSLVVKLSRPNLIFKQKTLDGGEQYLARGAETLVTVGSEDGTQKTIDLSQPVNYLHLGPIELTAIFNHPAINRHVRSAPPATPGNQILRTLEPPQRPEPPPRPAAEPTSTRVAPPPAQTQPAPAAETRAPPVLARLPAAIVSAAPKNAPATEGSLPRPDAFGEDSKPAGGATAPEPVTEAESTASPNDWMELILAQEPIRHDWFACLVYAKVAETLGNSRQGQLGLSACWAIALGETEDLEDPSFKGVFLTEKGGLGFLHQGHIARFNKGVAFLGTQESALEGIDVRLLAMGLDAEQRVVFIVSEKYRTRFDVPEQAVARQLQVLKELGAVVLSPSEVLRSPVSIETLWTVPREQANPTDPEAMEYFRPGSEPPA